MMQNSIANILPRWGARAVVLPKTQGIALGWVVSGLQPIHWLVDGFIFQIRFGKNN